MLIYKLKQVPVLSSHSFCLSGVEHPCSIPALGCLKVLISWKTNQEPGSPGHWEREGADSSAGGAAGAGSAPREEMGSSFKSEERQQPSWDVPGHPLGCRETFMSVQHLWKTVNKTPWDAPVPDACHLNKV